MSQAYLAFSLPYPFSSRAIFFLNCKSDCVLSRQIFPWPPSFGDRWKYLHALCGSWLRTGPSINILLKSRPGLTRPHWSLIFKRLLQDQYQTANASCSPVLSLVKGQLPCCKKEPWEWILLTPKLYSHHFLPPRPWIWWSPFKTRKKGQVRIHHVFLKIPVTLPPPHSLTPSQVLLKVPYDKTHGKVRETFSGFALDTDMISAKLNLAQVSAMPSEKGTHISILQIRGRPMLDTGGNLEISPLLRLPEPD